MTNNFNILDFNLNKSSLIEASAGTGKTYSITYLVLRLLLGIGNDKTRLLQGPLSLDEILIVTYTNAASADLKARVLSNIKDAIEAFTNYLADENYTCADSTMQNIIKSFIDQTQEEQKKLLLTQAIRCLERAKRSIDTAAICTIHSFCNRALSQIYSFEATAPFASTYETDINYLYQEMQNDAVREYFYSNKIDKDVFTFYKKILASKDIANSIKKLLGVRVASIDRKKHLNYLKTKSGYYFILKNDFDLDLRKSIKSNLDDTVNDIANEYTKLLAKIKQEYEKLLINVDKDTFIRYVSNDCEKSTNNWSKGDADRQFIKSFTSFLNELVICYDFNNLENLIVAASEMVIEQKAENQTIKEVLKVFFKKKQYEEINFVKDIKDFVKSAKNFVAEVLYKKSRFCLLFAAYIIEKTDLKQEELNITSNDDVILRLDRALNDANMGKVLAKMLTKRYKVAFIDEFQDTDPVQFSIFNKLYLSNQIKDKNNTPSYCYLIGDPKQSIYEFRGSDINSYLKAKNLIGEKAVYSLNTNYRSYPSLIESVNTIFKSNKDESKSSNSFDNENIIFTEVQANKGKYKFVYDVRVNEQNDAAAYIKFIENTKKQTKADLAKYCAYDVLHILSKSRLYSLDSNNNFSVEHKVKPSDIAILVSNASEFNLIKDALNSINIPCVYVSDKSNVLYEKVSDDYNADYTVSNDAQNIIYLMEAMCYNKDKKKVLRALACGILCIDNVDFSELTKEQSFEDETLLLEKCYNIWEKYGFLAAYNYFINDKINKKYGFEAFLSQQNGSRRIAASLHICELVQEYHNQITGPLAQLRAFKDLCYADNNNYILGSTQSRLDSQQEQINVVTIHKSKGLEYPIVLLPFIFSLKEKTSEKDFMISYYDKDIGYKAIDLDYTSKIGKNSFINSQEHYLKAINEEKRRLIYVALTRACAANFFYLGKYESKLNMFQILETDSIENTYNFFEKQNTKKILFNLQTVNVDDLDISLGDDLKNYDYQQQLELQNQAIVESFSKDYVDQNFSISSYSQLTAKQHESSTDYQYDGVADDVESYLIDDEDLNISPFDFPRGVQAGTFLHKLLEYCDFSRCNDKNYISSYIDKVVAIDSILLKSWGQEDNCKLCLKQWLYDITHCCIYQEQDRKYSLCDIGSCDRVSEMTFLMSSTNLDTKKVNDLCKQSMVSNVSPTNTDVLANLNNLYLDNKLITGFMTGAMDLVFRLKIDNCYKYFVLDYKSNFIGTNASYYRQANLEKMIFDNKNRYDVQYMIYSLALYRHLKSRLVDFDYESNMGGVIYLFLRGLKADQTSGVYHAKLEQDIVESLDKLCTSKDD